MTVKHSCVWLSFPKLLKLLQHSRDESHQESKTSLTYWLVVQGKDHSWTSFAAYSVWEISIVHVLHSYSFEAGCLWPLHNSLNIIPVLCLQKIETFICPRGMSESVCHAGNHVLNFLNANSSRTFKLNIPACLKSFFERVVLLVRFMSLCKRIICHMSLIEVKRKL